ncbi:Niemann-Pick type C-2g [Carabus blaptoides fortunei]
MTRILVYLLVTSFFVYSLCEVVKFSDCTDNDPKGVCTVHQLRINPCKEAASNKACKLKKGTTSTLQMDFTTLVPIDTMKGLPYWASVTDLPFVGMDSDACKFTACPIGQNVNQTYDFQLTIAKSLPRGTFDVKWKFWIDEEMKQGIKITNQTT